MDALIIAFATAAAVLLISLALIAHGIHRQERVGLDSQNAGLCAALTRKLLGVRASTQQPGNPAERQRPSWSDHARKDACREAPLASGTWS